MTRLSWHHLPPAARAAVQERTGPFLTAADVSTGANSGIAVKALAASGEVFIKGIPVDHRQVKTQLREAAVNPYLPKSCPQVLWHVQAGGWDLLGFEVIEGPVADFSPGSPDLPLVVDALAELARTPCPDIPLLSFTQRYESYSDTPELFAGDALLHTDMAPHNVLIDHIAHLIDWAWPTRGPAWADPAVWAVRLIDAGHTPQQAEQWASLLPAFQGADPGVLLAFAEANARHWQEVHAHEPASAWKRQMAASAIAWRDHRRHPAE
ncbi:aminoglycoside phosphotransferase [Streptomyces sp. BE20]|uniref:aminoglycoside phosphotransferase n=1 Tax=Streptomyces sp. BE20 TaxID=3002525 RepID=UPI002E75ECD1|nr:aminoglycoside phosphotransferase [Streptomyces sp. BE20]MEE1823787.1 aminoglycoside phosphotransferase [Streptomyces sp. BE20]